MSDEDDLVRDMMALIASFSGKLYRRRSAKRVKQLKESEIKKEK